MARASAGHLLVALLLAAAAVNTCADGASGDGAAPAPAEAPAAVGGAHPTRVLVQFKAAAAATARAQAAQPLKGLQLKRLLGKHQGVDVRAASAATAGRGPPQALPADGVYLFEITDALPVKDKIKELLATSAVEMAEPDYISRLDVSFQMPAKVPRRRMAEGDPANELNQGVQDPLYYQNYGADLYHLARIAAPTAWDTTAGKKEVKVCIVDSGARKTHQDLASSLGGGWNRAYFGGGEGTGAMPAVGSDAYSDYSDSDGHGTHIAGIIAASGNNKLGLAGVAYNVTVYACNVLSSDGRVYVSSVVDCFALCGNTTGVKVVSASYGRDGTASTPEKNAITALGTAGILFVGTAGNVNRNIDTTVPANKVYPAEYALPNQITVGASTQDDTRWVNTASSGSNYGATKVNVAAPGFSILSARNTADDAYILKTGTSMACPMVSATAALLFSAKPTATVAQVRTAILSTVDAVPDWSGKCSTGGRVNAAKALANILGKTVTVPSPCCTWLTNIEFDIDQANRVEYYVTGSVAACKTKCQTTSWCHYVTSIYNTDFAYADGSDCQLTDASAQLNGGIVGRLSTPGAVSGFAGTYAPPPAPPRPPSPRPPPPRPSPPPPPRPPPPPPPRPSPPPPRPSPPPPRPSPPPPHPSPPPPSPSPPPPSPSPPPPSPPPPSPSPPPSPPPPSPSPPPPSPPPPSPSPPPPSPSPPPAPPSPSPPPPSPSPPPPSPSPPPPSPPPPSPSPPPPSPSPPSPPPPSPSPPPPEPSPPPPRPSPPPPRPSPPPPRPSPPPPRPRPPPPRPHPPPPRPRPPPPRRSPPPPPVRRPPPPRLPPPLAFTFTARQSTSASATTGAAKANDRNAATFSSTTNQALPWWTLDMKAARKVLSVNVTARNDATFNQLKNVEVRVGNSLPGSTAATAVNKINTLCLSKSGQLVTAKGKSANLVCSGGAKSGRYVTIHIKTSSTLSKATLSLAEVTVKLQ